MYGSIYYDRRASTIHWSEYDEQDKKTVHSKKWVPDYYIESKNDTEYISQSGKHLKRAVADTFSKRKNKIKEIREMGLDVYGSDLSPETKFILENWEGDLEHQPQVRYMFFDIETESEEGFPDPLQAIERINLITCWSSFENHKTTFALEHDWSNKTGLTNVTYIKCATEKELLFEFIKYLEKQQYDIWSGWNSSGFDIQYIFNRILRILDKVDIEEQNRLMLRYGNRSEEEIKSTFNALKEIEKGYKYIKKLSPYGKVAKSVKMIKDRFTKEMKPQICYTIEGVTDYDYMLLDQLFRMGKRPSYKLDNVALDELGEQKKEHPNGCSFKEFYRDYWEEFVDYNIQDVQLLVRLNEEMNYIPQAIALSYKCHCTFKDNFGTVAKAESAVYSFLKKDNIILDDKENIKKEHPDKTIVGGYVTPEAELRRGMHKWIIDVDIASLYPSIMRGMNISYDTRVAELRYKGCGTENVVIWDLDDDEPVTVIRDMPDGGVKEQKVTAKAVRKLIKANNYHVSARDVIFKNLDSDKGVLVKMLDMWYAQRKVDKKKMAKYREQALEIFNAADNESGHKVEEGDSSKFLNDDEFKRYNEAMRMTGIHHNLQWSCKILLNSIYGCLGSKYSKFYGEDLAASVTMTGRKVIQSNGQILDEFFNNEFFDMKIVKKNFTIDESIEKVNCRLYTDTDSSIGSTKVRTNRGIYRMEDIYELYENKNKHLSQYGHEIVDVSNEDLQCLTYDEVSKNVVFGKIKKLVRHKVTKKKWRIRVDGKEVIVTEDHCAIVKRGGELMRLKPKEIKKGDKIITIG